MKKNEKILVDTDILIDFLKGQQESVLYIKNNSNIISISVISVAELFSGIRNKIEKKDIEYFLNLFPILSVTPEIAKLGGIFRNKYFKSFNVSLADAIIAATAKINDLNLKTLNTKHFPMFKGIKSPYYNSS